MWHNWRLMQNSKENWFVLSKMNEQFVKFLFTDWKNSNFSLESKMMVELNQNKNSK